MKDNLSVKKGDLLETKRNVTLEMLKSIGIDDDMRGIPLTVYHTYPDGYINVYSEERREGCPCSMPSYYLKKLNQ